MWISRRRRTASGSSQGRSTNMNEIRLPSSSAASEPRTLTGIIVFSLIARSAGADRQDHIVELYPESALDLQQILERARKPTQVPHRRDLRIERAASSRTRGIDQRPNGPLSP